MRLIDIALLKRNVRRLLLPHIVRRLLLSPLVQQRLNVRHAHFLIWLVAHDAPLALVALVVHLFFLARSLLLAESRRKTGKQASSGTNLRKA
jgi:hypothetical protein